MKGEERRGEEEWRERERERDRMTGERRRRGEELRGGGGKKRRGVEGTLELHM